MVIEWWFFPLMTITLCIGYIVGFIDGNTKEDE
jgi:hypothetical protein